MKRWIGSGLAVVLALLVGGAVAVSAQATDSVMPLEKYTTPKGRTLGTTYRRELDQFSAHIYHCLPWVAINKHGIGFYRPKWATDDSRYLSVWIEIQQDEDREFARMGTERRASAMLSRYAPELMRRMADLKGVAADTNMDGFTVILSWLKPGTSGKGAQPVNETLAFFVDRPNGLEFLAHRLAAPEMMTRAQWMVFDGEQNLGKPALQLWEDPFLSTFKLKDHKLPAGVTC
jgi:hypothetical protein